MLVRDLLKWPSRFTEIRSLARGYYIRAVVGFRTVDLTQRERLAVITLQDQFPGGLWRGTPQAYRFDEVARSFSEAKAASDISNFSLAERIFAIMPFGDSEALPDQDRALLVFDEQVDPYMPPNHFFFDAARRQSRFYREILFRFGRFPHRNAIFGRSATPEEIELIATPMMTRF